MTETTCPICLDDAAEPVSCHHCNATICYICFQRYLLSKELAVPCFNEECALPWSDDFIDEQVDDIFRNGDLRAHRSKILVDHEMARLPDLQERARRYKIASAIRRKSKPNYVREMLASYGAPITGYNNSVGVDLFGNGWCVGLRESIAKPAPKPKVLRACPGSCLGFLAEDGTCGLCNKNFCLKCHETLEGSGHVCNPDTVATVRMMAQETKPCPKCRAAIYKIDGCDQMWCTQCQTPFSWTTGKEETGRVHNPHYYEWMRRTKGSVPREPECREGELRCLPFSLIMEPTRPSIEIQRLIECFHRTVSEKIQYGRREPQFTDEPLNRAGIKYLAGQIKKDEWARRVYIEKRARARETGAYQIMRAFIAAATDILNGFIAGATDPKQTVRGIADLMIYMQESLDKLYSRYFYTGKGESVIPGNWATIASYDIYGSAIKMEEICGRTIKGSNDICSSSFEAYVNWALK